MPTYEYSCKDCGQQLEVVQSFTDESLTECPNCKGQLKKVFGSVGISFKGSGFYKTDSRAGSKTKPATTPASETSTSETTPTETKTADTKTETKTESKESKPKVDSPAAAPSKAP